jgi:REP element-mobilizing transposase RayT
MAESLNLTHKYEYRRRLPHYQKSDRAIFVTFRKFNRDPFSAQARDVVLQHCVHDDGKRITLHAAVVMPDHVHLLLTPSRDVKGWPFGLPAILKLIKGVSGRNVNRLLGSSGPVWQEESFDHVLRFDCGVGFDFGFWGSKSKSGQECPLHIHSKRERPRSFLNVAFINAGNDRILS